MVEQLTEIPIIKGDALLTLGYVNINMVVGPIQATTRFHVTDARTSYRLLV